MKKKLGGANVEIYLIIIFSNLRFTQSFKSSKITSLLKFAKIITVIHEGKLRKIDRFVF